MPRKKCKECMGCMDAEWIDNRRYFHCAFCNTYYGGDVNSLTEVDNPYLVDDPEGRGRIDRRLLKTVKENE